MSGELLSQLCCEGLLELFLQFVVGRGEEAGVAVHEGDVVCGGMNHAAGGVFVAGGAGIGSEGEDE